MKKKNIITALVITMTIGIGVTAYAAPEAAPAGENTNVAVHKTLGMCKITGMRGYDFVSNVLKKFNITDTDINQVRSEGKTIYDLTKEKGVSEETFKNALIEEKSKAVDEAVSKGNLTKEQGDALKADIKTNAQNCTGNFQGGKGKNSMNGSKGRGMGNGFGQGRGAGCGMQNGSVNSK